MPKMPPAILPGAIGGNRSAQPHCLGTLVGQGAGATDNRTPPVACSTRWRGRRNAVSLLGYLAQSRRDREHISDTLSYCARRQISMSFRARRQFLASSNATESDLSIILPVTCLPRWVGG